MSGEAADVAERLRRALEAGPGRAERAEKAARAAELTGAPATTAGSESTT